MSMTMSDQNWGLPDPDFHAEFYEDVPMKRLFAWVVDVILITLLTVAILPLTAFIGLFFFPLLWLGVSFLYRTLTIASRSATPGMRLMSIEFRTSQGNRLDFAMAFAHTLLYAVSVSMVLVQLVSMILIATSARAQSLGDHLLGTAAVNKAATF